VVVLLLAIGVGAAVGPVSLDLPTVARVIGHHVFGSLVQASFSAIDEQIVWELRLPEVLLAAAVGAGLSVVGATLQATVRNPLADPYLLGVSSGAGFMAAVVITIGSTAVAGLSTSGAAFAGALLTTALVLGISTGAGGRFAPTRVVLAGVTLSFFFLGLTNYLIFQSNDPNAATAVLFWSLGSLSNAAWPTLGPSAVVVPIGVVYLIVQSRSLNALVAGEETALSVGVDVRAFRARLLIVTSLVTGVMVAAAGGIAFVGLVVPHMVRLVVGPDHRKVLPVSALTGAIFLVVVDLICRVAVSPAVLPLGIVTSVLGAPFFLWLLRSSRSGAMAR
ncbi:MAG TPA: iron ABC transporter permease, partial [Pseudonocardiaceae bacterium]|nr:iron ABC transporter permease [Pseudonocardiaceae bacterium]